MRAFAFFSLACALAACGAPETGEGEGEGEPSTCAFEAAPPEYPNRTFAVGCGESERCTCTGSSTTPVEGCDGGDECEPTWFCAEEPFSRTFSGEGVCDLDDEGRAAAAVEGCGLIAAVGC